MEKKQRCYYEPKFLTHVRGKNLNYSKTSLEHAAYMHECSFVTEITSFKRQLLTHE